MTDECNVSPPCEDPMGISLEGEWKDKYLRLLAEQENLRKRVSKEKRDMLNFGVEDAIADFLPAIEQLENALRYADQAAEEVKQWAFGFTMILSQFKEVLQSHGIVPFPSEGERFDPRLHEAVEIVESEELPEGQILQEFTKGYKSTTRTLRPARVKVARRPEGCEVEQKSEGGII